MTNLIMLVACLLGGMALGLSKRLPENAQVTIDGFIIHVALPALVLGQRVTITDLKAVHRRFHPREQHPDGENDTKDDQSDPSCTENPPSEAQTGSRRRA